MHPTPRVSRARACLAALLLLPPTLAHAQTGVSGAFTGFEASEGYPLGPLDPHPDWLRDGALGAWVVTPGFDGDQRLEIQGTGSLAWIPATAFAPGPVWLDLLTRPVAGGLSELPPTAAGVSALTGFVQVGATGEIYVFDGHATPSASGVWRPTGVRLERAADGSFVPLRLTYRVDYSARRWDLFVDDRLVWADLQFADPSVAAFGRFAVRADSSFGTGLDFFYVGEANPLFADSSGDGIPDAWWTAHGLSATSSGGRHGDADSDGLSNLAEYLLGLDPTDPDSNHDGLPDGIATVDAKFRRVVQNAATLLADGENGLAWRASFSTAEGYSAGPLDGQIGWRALNAEVTSEADASARLVSSTNAAEIEQRFHSASLGGVWVAFRAKLQAGPLPEIQPERQPFAALFGFSGQRALTVRDGDSSTRPAWTRTLPG